ncbi:MAG TPA: M20 family metallopeptidase [Steroidobacteraceae bacterium]|nr:M20 family metallopeptidase [Steroidobacteraceae bacterium]
MTDLTTLNAAKAAAQHAIDQISEDLRAISLSIHDRPELGFEEHHAHQVLTDYLEQNGFAVTRGAYEMPTAFRAVAGSGEPTVAVLCEYDALPEIGHACGHNLIAINGIATATALKEVIGEGAGTIVVLGSPAEEGGGGKIRLIERGAFESVDFALLLHPSMQDGVRPALTGVESCTVEYFGRNAHAAARPQEGINALDALVLAYNAIAVLRQQIPSDARIHGVITKGGVRANIIPDYTAANFLVRSTDNVRLQDLRRRVQACFDGAALATGCRVEARWNEQPYRAMETNTVLARAFHENARLLGWPLPSPDRETPSGASSDMGNVSHVVPSIQPTYAIPSGAGNHNAGFTAAAATPEAHAAAVRAAKALAMTALDALFRPEVLAAASEDFRATHPLTERS